VLARADGAGETRVALDLVGPGRYEARVRGLASGSWLAQARIGQVRAASAGVAVGADLEHRQVGAVRTGWGGPGAERTTGQRESLATLVLALASLLVPGELWVRRKSSA
jgi:hypothetical protein